MGSASQSSRVIVSGGFDDLRSPAVRFLQNAALPGPVHAYVWSDALVQKVTGKPPLFPAAERGYLLSALKFVQGVSVLNELPSDVCEHPDHRLSVGFALAPTDTLPAEACAPGAVWAVHEAEVSPQKIEFCETHQMRLHPVPADQLAGFPVLAPAPATATGRRKKVIVTGCYDWLHSGHVRFFEEVSTYGDLYVIVGHDANIRLLKGAGHPLLCEQERRYMAAAIRYVKEALISSGQGWLDAEPEIERLRPDIYAVNEDGDKGGKREFCERHGIEYLVLRRTPAPGLPKRSSTDLRGF